MFSKSSTGDRLRMFLDAKNISQVEFGESVKSTKHVVHQWVADKRFPKVSTLLVLADMGCNLDWLITGRGSMIVKTDETAALRQELESLNARNAMKLEAIKSIIND